MAIALKVQLANLDAPGVLKIAVSTCFPPTATTRGSEMLMDMTFMVWCGQFPEVQGPGSGKCLTDAAVRVTSPTLHIR